MKLNKLSVVLIRNAAAHDFGGGERFPVFLAEELQRHAYTITLLTKSKKLLAFAAEKGIATRECPWWSRQNWSGKYVLLFPIYIIWQMYLFAWYLGYFFKQRPAVVHIQSRDDFISATFAGRLLGCRIIWTDHADLKHIWKNVRIWYKNPVGKLVYLAAHFVDTITLVSKSEKQLVTAQLKPDTPIQNKLTIVYNGAFDVYNGTNPHNFGTIFTFLVASRLVDDKGIREVMDAFRQIHAIHSNTQLVLLGDGPQRSEYEKNSHPAIHFYGHKSDPLSYIKGADVFVHPTYHEGFSVALVEASMLARPIIASSVGGNVEIIHDGTTGILIEPKSVSSLYVAMQQTIKDESLRVRLADNARRQYEQKFTFPKIVEEHFIRLYKGDER